jgi:small GTP-binding protein
LDQSKSLDLNVYEICVDSSLIQSKELIETYLFECQCALLLVDITKEDSFNLIKDLLANINTSKFPYLKMFLVLNKLDLESERAVNSADVNEFLQSHSYLGTQEISLKSGDNLKELLKKINTAENESKNELPINIVSETLDRKNNSMIGQGALSFILIGDSTVGKTCFLTRYFKNQFNETFLSTIGIDKEIKHVKVGNDSYKITLWDTAGQDRFKCLPKKYYQNADGVLLLFDVTNEETFNNVTNWMNDVKDNSNKNIANEGGKDSDIALFLIGNKIDLEEEREVRSEEGETFKEKYELIKFIESSAKSGFNALNIFIEAAKLLYDEYLQENKNKMVNDSYNNDDNGDTKSIGENYGDTSTLSSKRNKRSTCC